MALKRLQYELKKISQEPSDSTITAGPLQDSDIYHWWATIEGPPGTPFDGGLFRILIEYPTEYPFKPPKMRFETKIFHPNICRWGTVCMDILQTQWSPALTTSKVLLSICSLLAAPDLDHSINAESAIMYRENPVLYSEKAKCWTQMYASAHVGVTEAQGEVVLHQSEQFCQFCVPFEYLTPLVDVGERIWSFISGRNG